MYINEVIRRVDTLSPNEYTLEEKYAWCDELSAMLMNEYLKKYKRVTLCPDEKGEYIFPEGVTFEMIDRVIAQGREIEKYDFRSFGIRYLYGLRNRLAVPEHCQRGGRIVVIYLAQHVPIRTVKVEGVRITSDSLKAYFDVKNCGFQIGDSVKIDAAGEDFDYDNVLITDIEVKDDGECRVYLDKNTVTKTGWANNSTVSRIVTEQTVCDAPYDVMYVEFLLAQIARSQRNYNVYNQTMNVFNQKIAAYHNWLMERTVQNKDNKIRNWW